MSLTAAALVRPLPELSALLPFNPGSPRKPVIVVDTREQTPLLFSRLSSTTGTLATGDYSIAGAEELFSVERKTIGDLVSCCTGPRRERFERELHRLRGFRFKRLLVIGRRTDVEAGRYYSKLPATSV